MSEANISKLTDGNYVRWKRQVLIVLEAAELLEVVDRSLQCPDSTEVASRKAWKKKDLEAQALILSSCDDTNMDTIADSVSSKAMWDKLFNIHFDTSALNQAETMTEFYTYEIKEDQSLIAA